MPRFEDICLNDDDAMREIIDARHDSQDRVAKYERHVD